ncbi:MAG: T9SS type A sorting domain-containing protein [Tannerella sp.]|nr:T9SS type A sorting domain-containing protein [Tannerella sp.]
MTVTATSVADPSQRGTATVTVKEKIPDANEVVEGNNVKIYGVSGSLIVEKVVERTTVEVYDFCGKLVFKQTISGDVTLYLPAGIYVAIATNLQGNVRQKITIK